MNIKILFAGLVLSVCFVVVKAQTPTSKMNFSLQKILKEYSSISSGAAIPQNNSNNQAPDRIALFVKGNIADIKRKTHELGGTFKYAAGDIAAIVLPVGAIMEMASLQSVSRIENNDLKLKPLNDAAVVSTHVDWVHTGLNLPQGYDGTGVVVGIIDEGIDFMHPDFRNWDGTTRIKYTWDQTIISTDISVVPQPYNYGVQFIGHQIDSSGSGGGQKEYDNGGHGTHVAGIACGNGHAVNNYTGMAPGCDIVIVKANLDNNFLSSVADAVSYVFTVADSLNEPAVINISLGTYFGSHDGRDVQSQVIGNLIEEHAGRVVVAAAGNAGELPIHLQYNANSDTSFTWLQISYDQHGTPIPSYIELWGDAGNFNNVQMAVGLDMVPEHTVSSFNFKYFGHTAFNNADFLALHPQDDTIYNSSHQRMGIISHSSQIINGDYSVVFQITPDSLYRVANGDTAYYFWRMMTTGSGKIDAWSFDMISAGMPDVFTFPPIQYYKVPDVNQNIVSSFQCNDKVITVGSYNNRNQYSNANNQRVYDPTITPGELSVFSSRGPTRDGRIKPDITAPGGWVLSSASTDVINSLYACCIDKIAAGVKHYRNSGTSMASPMVAGICALYLQRYPTASWQDVKTALLSCTTIDNFTGNNLPNSTWGYGKANAYKMITGCSTTAGITELSAEGWQVEAYPNPYTEFATIHYYLNNKSLSIAGAPTMGSKIIISDVLGNVVKTFLLKDGSHDILLQKDELHSGIYFYSLMIDGKVVKTNKLAVM